MRPSTWTVAAALTLAGAGAGAQITNPVRASGARQPVNASRPIGRLDCESGERITFRVNYSGTGVFNNLRFWIGAQATSCTDMATRYGVSSSPVCWPIEEATIGSTQSTSYTNDYEIEARYLVDPLGGNCASPTTPGRGTINTNYLSLLADTGAGGVLVGSPFAIPFDLDPPATATDVTARPGEGSIEVTWRYPSSSSTTTTTTTTDASVDADDAATTTTTTTTTAGVAGFWVLCDPPGAGSDAGAGADAGDAGLDVPGNVLGADAGASCGGSFPSIDLYDVAEFNRYVRGSFTSSTATSLTVSGLTNGVSYRCAVVAEDSAGNRTMSAPSSCATPVPVTDFWERYRSEGGGASIECGARPHTRGGSPAALATLSLAAAALAARRRRRS